MFVALELNLLMFIMKFVYYTPEHIAHQILSFFI